MIQESFQNLLQRMSLKNFQDQIRRVYPVWDQLEQRPLVVFGAGYLGELFLKAARDFKVTGVYDGNPKRVGNDFCGHCVLSQSALKELPENAVIILATHRLGMAEKAIREHAQNTIIPFGALVASGRIPHLKHPFYSGLWEDETQHQDHFAWLWQELGDDKSRQVLQAALAYRQSFQNQVWQGLIEGQDYFPDLLQLSSEEVLIDGGAFEGDTLTRFQELTQNRYKAVIAFEPDPQNFAVLDKTHGQDSRHKLIAKGLLDQEKTLYFRESGEMDAEFVDPSFADGGKNDAEEARHLSDGGKTGADEGKSELAEKNLIQVPVTAIDLLPESQDATLIKLNIEGAEPEALAGAKKLIQSKGPKLSIAVYHRPDHLWRLARQIKEMLPAYQFYLRQHDEALVETVLYGVVRDK